MIDRTDGSISNYEIHLWRFGCFLIDLTTSCHISNRLQLRSRYISVILMKDVSWISSLYSSLYLFNERSRIIYNELWDLGFEMQKFEKCWILNQNLYRNFEFWILKNERWTCNMVNKNYNKSYIFRTLRSSVMKIRVSISLN